jgi:hypothetical protein
VETVVELAQRNGENLAAKLAEINDANSSTMSSVRACFQP